MSGRGAPGGNSRGRGGKFRKFTRGGGKHFSRDLRPLDADGNEIGMWDANAKKKGDGSDSEEDSSEEESSSEEEDSDDDAGPSKGTAESEALDRDARKNAKKARKEAAIAKAKAQAVQVGDMPPSDSDEESSEDDMPANPNLTRAARNQTKVSVSTVTEGMKKVNVGSSSSAPASRKEREAADAAAAKERYRKLHEAGKTDEAKADLARLKLIREKREAEAARKQAEKEERDAIEAEKKAQIEARENKRREAAMGPKAKGKSKK